MYNKNMNRIYEKHTSQTDLCVTKQNDVKKNIFSAFPNALNIFMK